MKRFIALLLCSLCLFALIPAQQANAEVLPGMTSKVDYTNTDPDRYVIEIDLTNQVITVYEGSTSGNIVIQSLCTTGDEEHTTTGGTFKVGSLKERFGYFVAYGQYAQYWTQVVRGIYIHSVMYNAKNTTSMSRNAYNNLGKNVSHGCVRVLPHVAQWIFYNCPPGTTCKVVKKTANPDLVKKIKATIPSYSKYVQPTDSNADPAIIPGVIRYDNVPLRTGFSTINDTTVMTLGAGDKVLLLQLGSDWCKVKTSGGKLGYVQTKYILCYPDSNDKADTYTATAKTYIYSDMDTKSAKLTVIPKGAAVSAQDTGMTYYYAATYNGFTGYVRKRYIKKTSSYVYPDLTGTATGDTTTGGTTGGTTGTTTGGTTTGGTDTTTGTTISSNVRVRDGILANMRSTPSTTGSSVVASLQPGTAVTVLSISGNWYYCQANGATGYIHRSCLVFN